MFGKCLSTFTLALALVVPAMAQQAAAQAPTAEAIVEGARIAATLQQTALEGRLSPQSGAKVPVNLYLKGKDIQFQFLENNVWRIFHMRLSDDSYDLFEIIDGKTLRFPQEKLAQPIAGTDMTYEDLAFRFFYWPNPKLEGVENVNGQECYKVRLDKPKGSGGRYDVCYAWIHTKFGAFMRIRGHAKSGALLKEFEVEDIMQISKGVWTLRKMQVATIDPASGRRASLTDMVFDKPKAKAGPKGLR